MSDTHGLISLPIGRLLYRELDTVTYVVVRHSRSREHWIVADGWADESDAAGPFSTDNLLRAVRLANTSIPDGCELGPSRPGIHLFPTARLPGHPNDWSRVETAWLASMVSLYNESDISRVTNKTCCAPPKDVPVLRVEHSLHSAELDDLVRAHAHGSQLRYLGVLRCSWNAHPEDSPVYGRSIDFSDDFAVVDLPS